MMEHTPRCARSLDRAHPHYAGDLTDLLTVAARAGIAVEDFRGSSSLSALRRMYCDAGSRYFSQETVNPSDVRVLVVDENVFTDSVACAAVTDIVSQVRWQGLYLWIDAVGSMPPGIAVQLTREHCNACTVRGLSKAMASGLVL